PARGRVARRAERRCRRRPCAGAHRARCDMRSSSPPPSRRRLAGVVGGARPDLLALVLLDVFEAIHDATAELDEARAFARPAPALKRAVADVPARSQIDL